MDYCIIKINNTKEMSKMSTILYYSDKCPNTSDFVAKLKDKGIDYQEVNITDSMKGLKEFLKWRDARPEFEDVKKQGLVGVPVLYQNDQFYFELD